jgi:hypothetical protein
MKKKSLRVFLIAMGRALIGGIVGIAIGILVYGRVLPFWTVMSIGSAPKDADDILSVNFKYLSALHLEENIIFIQSQSNEIYFGFDHNWERLSPLPNGHSVSRIWFRDNEEHESILANDDQGEVFQMTNGRWELLTNYTDQFRGFNSVECAKEWYLPVFHAVDSAGVVFAHALANEDICYILLEDGRLQVWTRATDVFSLFNFIAVVALIGMVIGISSALIEKRKES